MFCYRQEPTAAQQTMKRTWTTAAITNESFSKPPTPETKKHKASNDVTEPSSHVQQQPMVIPSPAISDNTQTEENHRGKDKNGPASTTPPVDKQTLNTSDKENKSLDDENESSSKQVD